ncbi:MAG: hypothetical protein P8179_19615 [Candidatus Thiodiazotropha sp.]
MSYPTIDAVRTAHRILRNHGLYRVFKRVIYRFKDTIEYLTQITETDNYVWARNGWDRVLST